MSLPDWAEEAMRITALVLLAVSTGAMIRYYADGRGRMPSSALVSYACFAFAMGASLIVRLGNESHIRWYFSPFVIAGSIAVIWGAGARMRVRHLPDRTEETP